MLAIEEYIPVTNVNTEFVLIVDDDIDFTESIADWIHRCRHDLHVLTAQTGVEAVNLVRRYQPALVLVDLHMGFWDGIQTCRAIQELGIGSRVVGLTGSEDVEERRAMLNAGAEEIVSKSMSAIQFLFRLNTYAPPTLV